MLRKVDRLQEAADYNIFPKPWQLFQVSEVTHLSPSRKKISSSGIILIGLCQANKIENPRYNEVKLIHT